MPIETAVTIALFLISAGLALAMGGRPERYGGIILLLWLGSERAYHLMGAPSDIFIRVDPIVMMLDTMAFFALLALAMFANRVWPVVAASIQTVVILGHISALVDPRMQRAYWVMTQIPPLFVALAILAGAIAHRARVRRIGAYRDWRRSGEPC
jgi:hypothetical protein